MRIPLRSVYSFTHVGRILHEQYQGVTFGTHLACILVIPVDHVGQILPFTTGAYNHGRYRTFTYQGTEDPTVWDNSVGARMFPFMSGNGRILRHGDRGPY